MKAKKGIAKSVGLATIDALRQGLQQRDVEQACGDADAGEQEAVGGERERHRIAQQQKHHQPEEHQRRQEFQ